MTTVICVLLMQMRKALSAKCGKGCRIALCGLLPFYFAAKLQQLSFWCVRLAP